MTAAAYGYLHWAGYYLFMGGWTLGFLTLTPLILKAMLFDRQPLVGLLLIGMKIILLLVALVVLSHWSRSEPSVKVLGTALVAGGVTPLVVVVLRALGGALEPQPETKKPKTEEGKP
jgi:hypothetical protein